MQEKIKRPEILEKCCYGDNRHVKWLQELIDYTLMLEGELHEKPQSTSHLVDVTKTKVIA